MTGAHNFFRLYALVICDHAPAQRNVEDFDFASEVPHSNHNTVGTASWQNHDSSSPQSAIILHCYVCLYLSNHNISSTLWGQCKSKKHSTFTRLWISPSCSGAGVKQWLQMTGALYKAHARIQNVSPEGVQLCNVIFFYFFFMGGSKYHYISGPSLAHH